MRRILTAAFGLALIATPLAACKKGESAEDGAPAASPAQNLAEGKAFLEKNAKEPGVVTLPSGVQYKPITAAPETAAKPGPTDEVKVHYEGKFLNGTVFDSSFERGVPATFPLNGVIPGWGEALQHMRVGDAWMIYIPSELAYGEHPEEHGAGELPPNSTLTFRVQLLAILPSFGLGGMLPPIAPAH